MALIDMQKVRMAVHKSVSDDLIADLQSLGCCQFVEQDNGHADENTLAPLRAKIRHAEEILGEVRFALRFLEPYATEKIGGLNAALGDVPSYSLEQLAQAASEDKFRELSSRLRELEKALSDARAGASRVRGLIAQLHPLVNLPYPLELFTKGTDLVAGLLLSVPAAQAGSLMSDIEASIGDLAETGFLPGGLKDAPLTMYVVYARECAPVLQDILDRRTSARVDIPASFAGTAAEEARALVAELEKLEEREEEVAAEVAGMANEAYFNCQVCSDYWSIQKAKLDSLWSGEQTEQILLLSFWVPKTALALFKKTVEPYESLSEVTFSEPDEDDQPPTMLANPGWASPVESLTLMYGTPTYGRLDPTLITAPFFYLFFGICFGDAGYGLLISGVLILLMVRKQLSPFLKTFCTLLVIGNAVAVAVGALTFSWFGDSIDAFPFLGALKPLRSLQILDPMNDPMTMLIISLALGFVQVMLALFLAMWENWRSGNKMAALADQGGWILFLCGLVMVGLSSAGTIPVTNETSAIVTGAGAVILVATQGREKASVFGKLFSGVMSLYNVTGYLGDVLSYSRLLALGLGSAAVGMVINLLASLVSGAPYVGVLLGALIFVLGHLFSIVVNMLGAFVHSLRLQYVEFFGKFFEATGEDYAPLQISSQYVKISEPAPGN